ncbi:VOC family protein [Aurantibacter crassamenti]|uniref:VOC family protein n=1 Tax=Aurantibacter crassamenti TaxID=1837375 RepID=UPI00193A2D3D|nr:VOC family protein [Aurantibacter crassamenti]MBM1106471.1 VOC family protein [Aurantibacter crassamenti]
MNKVFDIERLDHVAIRVKDMAASIAWYKKVLGLKSYKLPKWGEYPVFLLSGNAGIALFPADAEDNQKHVKPVNLRIDHFAFHVNNENLKKAIQHYESLNLEYHFKDHYYYHSIYTDDLDGHTVELTSLIEENSFLS